MYIEIMYMWAEYNIKKREQERLNYQGLNTGNEYYHFYLSIFQVLIMSKVFGILVSEKQIKIY